MDEDEALVRDMKYNFRKEKEEFEKQEKAQKELDEK